MPAGSVGDSHLAWGLCRVHRGSIGHRVEDFGVPGLGIRSAGRGRSARNNHVQDRWYRRLDKRHSEDVGK